MLDLSVKKNLYKIKWLDGTVLNLKAPTQRQYLLIQNLQSVSDYTDVIDTLYEIVGEIINNNMENKKIDDISDLGLDTCMLVLEDYYSYFQKQLENQVVFHNTQQQMMKK